jgi:hypothetical protein
MNQTRNITSMSRPVAALSMIASLVFAACTAGAQSVPTVVNVEASFGNLKHHGEWMGVNVAPLVSQVPTPSDHVQGIVRHPNPRVPIFYMSISNTSGLMAGDDGELAVVELGTRDLSVQDRMRSNRLGGPPTSGTAPHPADRIISSYRFTDYDHPGGMQICGNILAVPLEGPTSGGATGRIAFFDISNPRVPQRMAFNFDANHDIGVCGLTQLDDGRYLMVVTWGSNETIRFFTSQPNDITTLALYDSLDESEVIGNWPVGGLQAAHQSLSLIKQSDGKIFMIGMHNTSNASPVPLGEDRAVLYRLTFGVGVQQVFVQEVRTTQFYCADLTAQTGANGNFAGGGGAWVSPSGELMLYATTHAQDLLNGSWIGMSEFRHFSLNNAGVGSQCTAYVELYTDADYQGRSFVFEGLDRLRENWADFASLDDESFDLEDGFHDQASSVVWNLPVGTTARLYKDDTYRNSYLELVGTGVTMRLANLHNVNWTSGSGNAGDAISSIAMGGSAGLLPAPIIYVPTASTPNVLVGVISSAGGDCAIVNVNAGRYPEVGLYNKRVKIRALGGPVVMGDQN